MKIRVFSDVHNEFLRTSKGTRGDLWVPTHLDTDKDTVLILAGDIDAAKHVPAYLNSLSDRFKAVIHVAGNHEFYGTDYIHATTRMQEGLNDNVYHLNNDCVTIEGQKFVGTTMWTNLSGYPMVEHLMNDYRRIRYGGHKGYRKISVQDTSAWHARAYSFLANNITRDSIVVTHHQPLSPPAAARGPYGPQPQPTDWAYYAGLEVEVSEEWKPKAWISGHIHECIDTDYFGTRLITNCVGYPGEGDDYNEVSLYDL
jgi:predicted phosphohydrolase